jgi:ABC-2 type transport system ATP-binding protein
MPNLVSVKALSYKYPKSSDFALEGVSLEIEEGSFFALLGPNGAGKTTLLRLLCGRLADYTGALDVAATYRNEKGFLDSREYGVLLENPGVYPRLTVAEYLCYFAGFYGVERNEALSRSEDVLDKISGPALNMKLSQLSLGNKQKLQLARALVHRPKILILDEPVANLDPESRERVWNYIGTWRRDLGGTAIVCSHILAEMEAEATHYAIIDKGVVLRSGRLQESDSTNAAEALRYEVELSKPVGVEKLRKTLTMAGIPVNSLSARGTSLADIYRETVSR